MQPLGDRVEFRLRREQRERDVVERCVLDRRDRCLALVGFKRRDDNRLRQRLRTAGLTKLVDELREQPDPANARSAA
jgi:hypothetical protein